MIEMRLTRKKGGGNGKSYLVPRVELGSHKLLLKLGIRICLIAPTERICLDSTAVPCYERIESAGRKHDVNVEGPFGASGVKGVVLILYFEYFCYIRPNV